jgi:hypothetical protein
MPVLTERIGMPAGPVQVDPEIELRKRARATRQQRAQAADAELAQAGFAALEEQAAAGPELEPTPQAVVDAPAPVQEGQETAQTGNTAPAPASADSRAATAPAAAARDERKGR